MLRSNVRNIRSSYTNAHTKASPSAVRDTADMCSQQQARGDFGPGTVGYCTVPWMCPTTSFQLPFSDMQLASISAAPRRSSRSYHTRARSAAAVDVHYCAAGARCRSSMTELPHLVVFATAAIAATAATERKSRVAATDLLKRVLTTLWWPAGTKKSGGCWDAVHGHWHNFHDWYDGAQFDWAPTRMTHLHGAGRRSSE